MKWSESTLGVKINMTNVMIASMKEQQELLTANGISDIYTAELEAQLAAVVSQNIQQERFEGFLKESTSQLNKDLSVLGTLYSKAKKVIKINIPLPS